MTSYQHTILRKGFFAALWTVVFFILTSACCLVYFSSTAYEFADVELIDGSLDENAQPVPGKADMRNTGARVAYAISTMHESDIFAGLFVFSLIVSIFAGYVSILPGTDDNSMQLFMDRGSEDTSLFALSPHCPNCTTALEAHWKFCPVCSQERSFAQELTLNNFIRHTIPDILNIDGKFFTTLRFLFTKPGFLTLEYLKARKASYTLPTQMYFVIAALFFFVSINLDFRTEVLMKQIPQINTLVSQKAQENNVSVESIKQQMDDSLENFIPFYTFFMVVAFALFLKVLYPHWYYVEHLVFALHFISYFLILWMVLILVAIRFQSLENFAMFLPLPYLYLSLKNVHSSNSKWKVVPAAIFFLALFNFYFFIALGLGILLL